MRSIQGKEEFTVSAELASQGANMAKANMGRHVEAQDIRDLPTPVNTDKWDHGINCQNAPPLCCRADTDGETQVSAGLAVILEQAKKNRNIISRDSCHLLLILSGRGQNRRIMKSERVSLN